MNSWTYNGMNVQVPRTADIPPGFWPRNVGGKIVQLVLDEIEPWDEGDEPIETVQLEGMTFKPQVVPLRRRPYWGIHAGHHARNPQASPFVRVDRAEYESLNTDLFTIELLQSTSRPKLVRAYPGEYIPPLPWMHSAGDAPGGVPACVKFWRQHAYVYRKSVMARRVHSAPAWFNSSR